MGYRGNAPSPKPSGSGEEPSREINYATLLSEFESASGAKLKLEKLMKLEEIISKNPKYEKLKSVHTRGSIEAAEGQRLIDAALLDLEYQHLDRILHAKQKPFHLAYLEDEPIITGPRLEMLFPTANGGFEKIQVPVGIKKSPGTDWYIFAEDLAFNLNWPSYESPMDAIEELESIMEFLASTPRRCPKPEEEAPFYTLNETGLSVRSVSPTNSLRVKNGKIANLLNDIYAAEYRMFDAKPEGGFEVQLAWAQKFPDKRGASEIIEMSGQIDRYQQEIAACNDRLKLNGNGRYQLSNDFLYRLLVRSKADEKISRRLGVLYTLSGQANDDLTVKKWLHYFELLEQKMNQGPADAATNTSPEPLVAEAPAGTSSGASTATSPHQFAQASASSFSTKLRNATTAGSHDGEASLEASEGAVLSENPDGKMLNRYFSWEKNNEHDVMVIRGMNPQEVRDSRVHDFIGKSGESKAAYELGVPEEYTLRSTKGGKSVDYTWRPDEKYGHTWKDEKNNRLLVINGTKIEIIPNERSVVTETSAAAAEPLKEVAYTALPAQQQSAETPDTQPLAAPASRGVEATTGEVQQTVREFRANSTTELLDALVGPDTGIFKRRRLLKRLGRKFPDSETFTLHVHEIAGGKIAFDITAEGSDKKLSRKRFAVGKTGTNQDVKNAVFARLMDKKDTGEDFTPEVA